MSSVDPRQHSRIVKPRAAAPDLDVTRLGGERFRLHERRPTRLTMLLFYRGLHCPACKGQLRELEGKLGEFESRGVEVLAVSGDGAERAAESARRWELERLDVGYGLSLQAMRDWGLFVSRAIKEDEPDHFNEPAIFLVAPDHTIAFEAINSAPFARPPLDELIAGLDFVAENDYPARGEA